MATSVLLACGLNEPLPPAFTFVSEETDMDASFLVTCILGQRTKSPTAGTVLVCLHHTFQHYIGAGVRLGFNLQAARDKGALHVIEPLADLTQQTTLYDHIPLTAKPAELLAELWRRICTEVSALLGPVARKPVTVMLDDVSVLIDLGCDEAAVLRFCRQLEEWASDEHIPGGIRAVIVKLNTCDLYEQLTNNLETLADAEIRCVRLRSGNFREVDGRLVSVRRLPGHGYETVQKSMLYKVNERNVKIFAPGEVGIRI